MRILYLAFVDLATPMGWTIHVLSVCRHLQEQGHSVVLVTPSPSRPVEGIEIPWIQIPVTWTPIHALLRFQWACWRGLPSWVRTHRVDAVYARMIPYAAWLPARASALGVPLVVEVNAIVEDEMNEAGSSAVRRHVYRLTERLVLEGADGVVAVTPRIAERLTKLNPGVRRVDVVLNGVDPDRFDTVPAREARALLGVPEGPWVGFVGAFYRFRALDVVVRAMDRVRAVVPGARLLLGGDGPERARIEEEARRIGGDVVRFLGQIAPGQVPMVLAAVDVCVFLTTMPWAETSIKMFEYLAARRPVVASKTGGVGAWMEAEGVGVSVDPSTPESIAEGIVRVLGDPQTARDMGTRGRALVERNYTWRNTAEGVANCLERARNRATS